MSYKHFTLEDREKLALWKAEGKSNGQIAKWLNKSTSAVGKELKKNSCLLSTRYFASFAEERAKKRRKDSKIPFQKVTPEMLIEIKLRLTLNQSPDQIVGRMKLEGKKVCSHETIYQMIYQNHEGMGEFVKYLRRKRRKRRNRSQKRKKRGAIQNRIGIEERPEITGKGHWEGDTMIGKNHKGAIATFVDKNTKYLIAQLMSEKTSQCMNEVCRKAFKDIDYKKSFTFDNGSEFAGHEQIKGDLGIDCHFANPYHSWERGLNEHTNGLLREYFPKKTDFKELSEEILQFAVILINSRPRISLDYRTPEEVYFSNSDTLESIPVSLQF